MRCPECDSDNPDDSKFCKECGTNISSVGGAQPSITKTLETPREELTTGSTFAGRRAVDLHPIKKDATLGTEYIMNLSYILIIDGKYEEAISHLEHMMSIPAGRNVSIASLQSQAIYDPLRDLPRFKGLLEKYSQDDS